MESQLVVVLSLDVKLLLEFVSLLSLLLLELLLEFLLLLHFLLVGVPQVLLHLDLLLELLLHGSVVLLHHCLHIFLLLTQLFVLISQFFLRLLKHLHLDVGLVVLVPPVDLSLVLDPDCVNDGGRHLVDHLVEGSFVVVELAVKGVK